MRTLFCLTAIVGIGSLSEAAEPPKPSDSVLRFLVQSAAQKAAERVKADFPIPVLNDGDLKSGMIGRIEWASTIRVDKVVDENTILGTVRLLRPERALRRGEDPSKVGKRESYGATVYLGGIETRALAAGNQLSPRIYEVTGVRSYTLAGVKHAAPVLKRFDLLSVTNYLIIASGDDAPDHVVRFLRQSTAWRGDADPALDVDYPIPHLFNAGLKPGQIGTIEAARAIQVLQMFGDGTMRAAPVMAKVTASGYVEEHGADFILEELAAGGLSDGQKLQPGVYEVTGTRAYTTVAGARRTVPVLRPYDTGAALNYAAWFVPAARRVVSAAKQEDKKDVVEKSPVANVESDLRIWTDSDGLHTTEARFGGLTAGLVTLTKKDGTKVQLPLEKLSDKDRNWIENKRKSVR